jgi:hypothetical protein
VGALKVGVYLCSGPNPIFLRSIMLQLEAQRRMPEVIAVYENGSAEAAYPWCCGDIKARLYRRGVRLSYRYQVAVANKIERFNVPLKVLFGDGCDAFIPVGADNFFYEEHVDELVNMLGAHDWVLNTHNEALLVRYKPRHFLYNSTGNLAWNPIGGMPDNVVFNRKFAEQYISDLDAASASNEPEDIIMGRTCCHEGLDCAKIAGPTTCCYVSHGTNESTGFESASNWQEGPPPYFDATWGK